MSKVEGGKGYPSTGFTLYIILFILLVIIGSAYIC
ncbi:YjcZ family sporulation protein [Sutcliffiella halmapala]|nr:YjcZ family sporulation protein [Sutcliffiella halmapala]